MLKGAIIANGFYQPQKLQQQIEGFLAAFAKCGTTLDVVKANSLPAYLDTEGVALGLDKIDFALFLDKDIHIARMLEAHNIRLFNCANAIELCDDKIKTYIALSGKLKMPKTVSAPLNYVGGSDDGFLERIQALLGYPIVVKEAFGSYGKQVYLANDYEQLRELWHKLKLRPHLYQEMICDSYGKDVRITVVGGKYIGAILRQNKNDFRSNLELGATAYSYEPPPEFIYAAQQAAKILGLDFCGIDLLFGQKGEPIFCEANSNAFFRTTENLNNIDISALIAQYVCAKLGQ